MSLEKMSFETVELEPNRNLLNPSFDGYKLSLEPVETVQKHLRIHVERRFPDSSQYTLHHAKLFGLHNHLTADLDDPKSAVYFVDAEFTLFKAYVDAYNELNLVEVWRIPRSLSELRKGDFNVTLKFAGKEYAVFSDGMGYLYLLRTGNRTSDAQWDVEYMSLVTGGENFIVCDASYWLDESLNRRVEVLLSSFSFNKEGDEKFKSVLHWVTLSQNGNAWLQTAARELKSRGVHYASFSKNNQALYVISDIGCKFTSDSNNPIAEEVSNENQTIQNREHTWSQTDASITVTCLLEPETSNPGDIEIIPSPNKLIVRHKNDQLLLSGELYEKIDPTLTTKTVENSTLTIVLTKAERNIWPDFILNDHSGSGTYIDPLICETDESASTSPGTGTGTNTTFNSEEIEECDYEEDKSLIFERIDSKTHKITHRAAVAGQLALVTNLEMNSDSPPAFGIRWDVDVCLWQPRESESGFELSHEGTLHAFAYIQASKRERKFSACSPDLGVSVVCESSRHVFVYRQNKEVGSGELRNRVSGARVTRVARQHVVVVPDQGEIVGAACFNDLLYVLCQQCVLAYKF